MCGTIDGAIAAGALTAWAQCWFLLLVLLVVLTIGVLFIIALLCLARL